MLGIVKALSDSPPSNKLILIDDDEDNSVVIPLAKRSNRYNPPAIHVMAFILAIPEYNEMIERTDNLSIVEINDDNDVNNENNVQT
ncbi:hypothetical protein TNCV_941291 [Trichonephila clavipes]|nr:hypothetical protein TNCV_941291 [Trichonephila clavipes]